MTGRWIRRASLSVGLAAAALVTVVPSNVHNMPAEARRATTLSVGKYLGNESIVAALSTDSTTTPKPEPSSDPNGAIEQWRKQVGDEYVAHEQSLDTINTWLNSQSGLSKSGYVGIIEDAKTFSAKLLWHGSDQLLTATQEYAEKTGAAVTVEQRPYSQAELGVATATLWSSRAALKTAGFELTQIVQVEGDAELPVIHGIVSPSTIAATVLDLVQQLSGVRYTLGDARTGVFTNGRGDDTSAFFGGALMVSANPPNNNSDICSTGFSVNYGGKVHTTTARHCQPESNASGSGWYSYSRGARMGPVLYTANTGALNVLVGNGTHFVYVGNYSSSTNNTVVNVITPGIGSTVCGEGGNSGAHCNITIHATGVSTPDSSSPSGYVSTVRGDSGAGGIANMAGDSGGPVVKEYGSAGTQVSAVGMIQAGDSDSRLSNSYCLSQSARNPQACYSSIEFSYMSTVQNNAPITVATGN